MKKKIKDKFLKFISECLQILFIAGGSKGYKGYSG